MKLKMPKFANESEEADWWYANRKKVERALRAAEQSGKSLSVPRILEQQKHATRAISIRLSAADIELAKQKAQQKGIGYQTLIRSLLHESLHGNRP